MSLALLAPAGLFALFALALPLALHLVRRGEESTIEFAALRWITARVPPRRRVRVERPWLLALRLALFAALALLLAQPVLQSERAVAPHWIAVAPGADLDAARAVLDGDGDWHRLAPGFPALDAAIGDGPVPVASLLRQLDAEVPAATRIDVVVPQELGGLDGERIRLGRTIGWHVVPGHAPISAAPAPATTKIALRFRADEPGAAFVRAAVTALNADGRTRFVLDEAAADAPIPADANWLIRLADGLDAASRAWIERGGRALVARLPDASGEPLWRDADGRVLARRMPLGAGWLVALAGPLAPDALPLLPDAEFPTRLAAALEDTAPAPDRAFAADAQPAGDATRSGASAALATASRALDPWLALLAAFLFLAERIVATRAPRDTR